jgi:single-strand DNA-binding protein
MNICTIVGRMGKDPEAFQYSGDKQGCRFSVAVDRPREDDPDWFSVTCFGQSAQFALQYLAKGREVAVTGDVHLGSWGDENDKRYSLDLVANRVEGIGPKQEGGAKPAPQQAAPKPAQDAPEIDWTMEGEEDPFADE